MMRAFAVTAETAPVSAKRSDASSRLGLRRAHRTGSRTAEAVAAFRALERVLPEPRRVVDDPFAQRFLGPMWRTVLAAARVLGPRALGAPGAVVPGLRTSVVCRHRWIDDAVSAALDHGVSQVAVLGAGYDTRAARLARPGVRFFELDLPGTQARKRARMPQVERFARLVAVDLAESDWPKRLAAAGWRPDEPTAFVWEGVSMYLPPEAGRRFLATVRGLAAPGSVLLCDFWFPSGAWQAASFAYDAGRTVLRSIGEPVLWPVTPTSGTALAARTGWRLARVVPFEELGRRLAPGRPIYRSGWMAQLEPS